MTLEVTADPLVLERTVNRIIYGNGNGSNGNGYSGSSGGFLYESLDWTPSSDHVGDTSSLDPVSDDSSTTSRLSSILGPGALGAGAGSAAAAAFSSMLEMGDEQQSDFVPEGPDDFLPEPSPRESYSEPAPYEAPRNYEVEPSFEPSARADQEEMLPVARRSDIIEEDRDRPGERTILPGRFLTPGIKEGTYFATQYVDRRREDYESEELTESQQSGIYDRSEPVGADERLESVGAGSSDAPAAYESSSADAPNSSNDDSDFFPDEPVSSSMPPADDDDVPVEESRPSIGESIAAVAAAGTAFAAGAALAAARSTGPGSDFFSSTVPPASEAPQVVASVERVSSPEFIPAASSSPVPSAAAPVFSPAPAVSPPVPTGDFPDSPSPVAAVAPATFLPDSAPPFSPTPPITVTPQSVAPEPVAFQPQPQPSPGMMDFFTATGGGFMSGERNTAPIVHHSPAQEPSMFPSGAMDMMGGGTASIIQNAIQAGARASATQTSDSDGAPPQVDPFDKVDADTAARKKKKSEKARSKSASSSKDGKDGGSSASGAKSSKSKSSLAAARTKSGSKKKTEASEDDEGKNISIGGFSLPKKMAAIAACLIVFVAFPVCVLIGNVASLVGGLGSATSGGGVGGGSSAKGSSLTGNWQIAYMNPDGRQVDGIMSLQQKGDTIEGWGNDPKASFQVAGKLSQNPQGKVQIQLNKQYLNPQNQPLGKPIVYFGVIDGVNPQGPYFMHISGLWKFQKRQGYSWRAQIVELTGKWEAALTNPGSDQAAVAGQPTGPGVSVKSGNAGMPGPSDPKSAQGFFFNIAIGLLGVGGLIAFLSLWIFGPSGKLNILAKKEYIPSQFKPQHFKLVREMGRPLKPGGVPIGIRCEWNFLQFWMPRQLALPPSIRETNPHALIIGQGSKGKSRLMATMITNDIEAADRAVIVVDSDGTLVDMIMEWISAHPKGKEMSERVIVIDPTRDGSNMCYNPLQFPEDGDLQNAASAIVFGFKAIYTEPPGAQSQWNQQTANILRNCSILLMANGKTLTDLPVLLSDNDQRDLMLEKIERMKGERTEYTTLIDAWGNYKRLARTDQWINWIEPILNRVQPMLGDPRIRPILTKAKGDIDIAKVIKQKQVLLVKIPQGQLDQNGNLLGSLIVTGVKQAALSLSKTGNKKRPCALYLDEFDSFIEKETFDAITTETRKFQVGLCSVAKTLQGLPEDYRNQIIANIGSMAVFSLTKKDGDMLGPQMFRVDGRKVKHQTIQNVFNKVNTSPQFELISDEEKLNIDRVVAQEERTYFFYRVGSVAGVFNMKAPEFKDIPEKDINHDLIDQMYENRQEDIKDNASDDDEDDDDDDDDD